MLENEAYLISNGKVFEAVQTHKVIKFTFGFSHYHSCSLTCADLWTRFTDFLIFTDVVSPGDPQWCLSGSLRNSVGL